VFVASLSAAASGGTTFAQPAAGTPQTSLVQAIWEADLTSFSDRTCQGVDGIYLEFKATYAAPAGRTASTDPRLDGELSIKMHGLLRVGAAADGTEDLGTAEGTFEYFSDPDPVTGKRAKLGTAAFAAVIAGGHVEGYLDTTKGADLRKTPTLAAASLDAQFEIKTFNLFDDRTVLFFDGGFTPTEVPAGGVTQSFACKGAYIKEFPLPGARQALKLIRPVG
jgi:hypothetical protein